MTRTSLAYFRGEEKIDPERSRPGLYRLVRIYEMRGDAVMVAKLRSIGGYEDETSTDKPSVDRTD